MRQGINLNFVRKRRNAPDRPLGEALELCRNSGFRIIDHLTQVQDADWLDQAKRVREEVEARGMTVHQSHCPFFRYQAGGLELFAEYAPRAVEAAAVLGSKILVIHADEYREPDSFDPARILRRTCEYLAPVVALCVERGIRPAVENLFEDGLGRPAVERSRFTSQTEEILALMEHFSGSGIGCCWDSGHAQCAYGEKWFETLETLSPYLICTHLHDNSYRHDMHKPAFFGSLDWERIMLFLKTSGYSGDFTWEFVYERFPDELLPEFLQFVHKTGEYLIRFTDTGTAGKEKNP